MGMGDGTDFGHIKAVALWRDLVFMEKAELDSISTIIFVGRMIHIFFLTVRKPNVDKKVSWIIRFFLFICF